MNVRGHDGAHDHVYARVLHAHGDGVRGRAHVLRVNVRGRRGIPCRDRGFRVQHQGLR